jgi:hypothetical protein
MVVLASCCKGKEISPWRTIPKLDEFFQASFYCDGWFDSSLAQCATKGHRGENLNLTKIKLYSIFVLSDIEVYSTYNLKIGGACTHLKKS